MLKIPLINVPEGQWFYLSSRARTNLTGLLLFASAHLVNSSVRTKPCGEVYSGFCHGCNQIASLCLSLSPGLWSALDAFAEPHRCLVATLPFAACISGFIYEYHLSLTRSLWGSISFSCTLRDARVMGVREREGATVKQSAELNHALCCD